MSSASANSSTKTSKEVKQKKGVEGIRAVGGLLQVKEFEIEMNPEYSIDFSTPMMELSKSVGTFTKVLDKDGNIVERVDDKTGVKYRFNENKKRKSIKKSIEEK